MIHETITRDVLGSAMKVLNTLRPGLDEKLYENALVIELRKQGYSIEQQKSFPVSYDGKWIGTLIPDLIVNDAVIVDSKVVTSFSDSHIAQMLGYLNITDLRVALLINFKHMKLGWKRVVNDPPNNSENHGLHR